MGAGADFKTDEKNDVLFVWNGEENSLRDLTTQEADLRRERYRLQVQSAKLLPKSHSRLKVCHRLLGFGKTTAEIRENGGVYRFSNLAVCGYAWTCPVCSRKIAHHRGEEIRAAFQWAEDNGVNVGFLTLTVRHDRKQTAKELANLVTEAWRNITGHRRYNKPEGKRTPAGLRDRYGVIGYIRALEVTHGQAAGWHPHLHIIFFSERELDKAFESEIFKLWKAYVVKKGYPAPTRKHGVMLQDGSKAGEYINKYGDDGELLKTKSGKEITWDMADELTKANIKKGREANKKPFQLLQASVDGDKKSEKLYVEFARAFHGKSQLQWKPKFKDEVGVEDVADEQLAEAKGESDLVFAIPKLIWSEWLRCFTIRKKPKWPKWERGYTYDYHTLSFQEILKHRENALDFKVELRALSRQQKNYDLWNNAYQPRNRATLLSLAEKGGIDAMVMYMDGACDPLKGLDVKKLIETATVAAFDDENQDG